MTSAGRSTQLRRTRRNRKKREHKNSVKLKIWFLETRPQFLLLSVVLAFLGNSIAWYDGSFNLRYALLAFIGLLLTHISVNTLNDYFDYKSGIDLETNRTPFSGGSGVLPEAMLSPRQVFWLGMGAFLLTIPIGIYFIIVRGWLLLPLLVVAAICILAYTPLILKTNYPEWVAGLGLGTLPVLGTYFVQTGAYLPGIIASIPSGFLVYNLLLLNEFPDVEADKKAGRKTLPIVAGRKKAGIVYSILTIMVYVWIIGGVVIKQMPAFSLIALLTLPLAIKAIQGARTPEDMTKLVPAMANNVLVVLLTQLLMGIGYILAVVF
jgi:1,4-dihydroxy-2-naphthoate octaprenyltransferase